MRRPVPVDPSVPQVETVGAGTILCSIGITKFIGRGCNIERRHGTICINPAQIDLCSLRNRRKAVGYG